MPVGDLVSRFAGLAIGGDFLGGLGCSLEGGLRIARSQLQDQPAMLQIQVAGTSVLRS